MVRYDFLWKDEQRAGRDDGSKDRPCAIILVSKPKADGSTEVALCPITHSEPQGQETGVKIPLKMARHLGLDDQQSWIKTHELNSLIWPKDQVPFGISKSPSGAWSYGMLHKDIGAQVFTQLRENAQNKTLQNVRRDELLERYERLRTAARSERHNDRGQGERD